MVPPSVLSLPAHALKSLGDRPPLLPRRYGIGKVIDLFGSGTPAFGFNGTNNGFTFTEHAVKLVRNHSESNRRRVLLCLQDCWGACLSQGTASVYVLRC